MTTLEAFGQLSSISSGGQTLTVNGSHYSVVISGLISICIFVRFSMNAATTVGNSQLLDVGHILDVQDSSVYGTFISNNGALCFETSLDWVRRPNSYLEYNLASVCLVDTGCIVILSHSTF